MNVIFKPHPGPQTRFMQCTYRYALIGGAAFGGKSECLRWDPWRQILIEQQRKDRGEITSSTGRAIFFRRTMPELREVMDRCQADFRLIDPGAVWHEQTKTWTMSCGYKYMFGQMEEDKDWTKYQGFQFTWCVEVGTRIRMADGSLWPIEKVRPGDMVLTLEGPRAVVSLSDRRTKPCIRAVVSHRGQTLGEQVHPVDHPLLTIGSTTTTGTLAYTQASAPSLSAPPSWLSYESLLCAGRGSSADFSSSTGAGSDYVASDDSRPAGSRPGELSVPVVLYVPESPSAQRQMGVDQFAATPLHGVAYAQQETGTLGGSLAGYRAADDFHGGQLQYGGSASQASFLQQGHAGIHSHFYSLADAPGFAQGRNRPFLSTYVHPYTGEARQVSADLRDDLVYGSCKMTPVGPRSVVDITISGASHYITESGLINRNCGFDELTSFTEEQFDKLDVWLRSKDPVLSTMLAMRAGTNPIGPGLIWVRSRFFDVAPAGTPVAWEVKVTTDEDGVKTQKTVKRMQIFIPARVSDNKSVDEAEFAATLSTKSAATRKALLQGDWYAGAEGVWVGDDWDPDIHVCKPFKIPRGWPKFRCGDYGYSWPGLSSIQWVVVDTDGNFVVYRSLTTTRQNAEMLAHRIREIEMDAGEWDMERGCSALRGPLDGSCWNQTGAIGPTIAESFFNVGVVWDKCDKNREAAAEQMRQRLVRRTAHPTRKDDKGKPLYCIPGIRWFDTCWSHVLTNKGRKVKVGPVVTIPTLQADDNNPDLPDTKGNDHDYDAISYGCMSRPLQAENDKETLDEISERRKRIAKSDKHVNRLGYPVGAW